MKNIKKLILSIIILIIVIVGIIIYTQKDNKQSSPQICINETCFDIEIARTPTEREYGLMNRTSLPEKSGMLFIFEQLGPYKFWMKNTLIPLDMLWIDDQNKIIDIEEATPCTQDPCAVYGPEKNSLYVLELNKGISKKYGLKVGDTIEINQ